MLQSKILNNTREPVSDIGQESILGPDHCFLLMQRALSAKSSCILKFIMNDTFPLSNLGESSEVLTQMCEKF